MSAHAIVLVGFEPDWQALYVEGQKVAEGHKVRPEELVQHTAEYVGREGNPTVQLETTHVENDELDEHGEFDIPDTLVELEERAPGAYGRISA
jgi:hypothetical protein